MSTIGARVWPWVPALLLSGLLAGLGTMAAIAVRDPGFALERDYYKKAVGFDREIAQRAENARLGWSARVEVGKARPAAQTPIEVALRDPRGPVAGARVRVEALRNAAASRVLEARFVEVSPGVYRADLPFFNGGLWELRFVFERERERMTEIVRRDVSEARP